MSRFIIPAAFLVVATVRKYRQGGGAGGGFLAVGVGWFVATVVADLVVDSGAVDFVYLSDIGFLGFVVAMSTELVRDTIDAERDLLAIQSNLVELVDERTSELRQAQAELVEDLRKFEHDQELTAHPEKERGWSPEDARTLARVHVDPGYASLSLKAVRNGLSNAASRSCSGTAGRGSRSIRRPRPVAAWSLSRWA